MVINTNESNKFDKLRLQAEKLIRENQDFGKELPTDMLELIHELKVHQAELSIQNEELQRSHLEISDLHKKFQDLYQFAPCGYLTLNSNGIITETNLTAVKILRTERNRLLRSSLTQFISPDFEHYFYTARKKAGQINEKQTIEVQIRSTHENPIWVLVCIDAVLDECNAVSQWRIVLFDITKRKQTEFELYYQARMLNAVGQAVIATDAAGKITYFNHAAEELYGWSYGEVEGKNIVDVTPLKNSKKQAVEIMNSLKNGNTWRGEFLAQRKDGSELYVHVTDTPIYNEKGEFTGIIGISEDITDRKTNQQAILASEETYRNLFQNAQVGLFRTRIKDGKILESNEQLAFMFGYENRKEFIAEYFTSKNYVDQGTREQMLDEIREYGDIRNFEARFYRKDGSIFWARYSAKIYPDEGWIEGVAEDINEHKKAQEGLEDHKNHLEELVEERTKELEKQNRELENFNSLFVGREFRIKELKDKLKAMEKEVELLKNDKDSQKEQN